MPLNTKVAALVQDRRYGLAITGQIERLRAQQPHIADAFTSIQNAVNDIFRAIAQETELTELTVTDPITGERIAWIGGQAVGNISYSGAAFARLWVGPNADPATAPFFSDGSNVVIGKNGQIFIQDSGENTVGWLGVEQELPQTITAATNASPVVVTITGHGYIDGDTIIVAGATGNTAINGYRIVQNVTANTFTMTDLSGTVINGNGAYAGTATATRYYAGLLTQTIAIGESFANYKLRAFADGTLKISNAEIDLTGAGGSIVLDPTGPSITATDVTGNFVTINGSAIGLVAFGGNPQADLSFNQINLKNTAGTTVATITSNTGGTEAGTLNLKDSTATKSVQIDPSSATAINTVGGGNINTSGVYKVAGTQVVGPQLTAIPAPTVNTTAIPQTAGAAYTANEQAMLASLKTAVGQLNADVISLQTAANDIRVRLAAGTGHGLTA